MTEGALRLRPLRRLPAVVCLIVAALAVGACGVTAPRSNDGFADLGSLGMRDTDRVLSLSIGPALLRFAARHIDGDEPTRELLESLDGVRVRIYEIEGDAGRVAGRIDQMSVKLQQQGWEPVLLLRDADQTAHMLLRTDGERILGMTVLVMDGVSEAVIVNLMGDIQPAQFGAAMTALDVETPGLPPVAVGES